MNDSIFEATKIRTAWYDVYGILKEIARPSLKPAKKRSFATTLFVVVASSLIGLNASTAAVAPRVPTQLTLEWPTGPTATYTKQQLSDALHAIRKSGADWNGESIVAPAERAIVAAERILPQLPPIVAEASAGVDGDGNIYFRMKKEQKLAYLTIEPKLMHLLVMETGQPNVYVDDAQFSGKVLPPRVKELLAKKFTS